MPGALERIFVGEVHRPATLWSHHLPILDRHLAGFRDGPFHLLQLGADDGGLLQVWRRYFGSGAAITCVDADPAAARFADDQVEIVTGDRGDLAFLSALIARSAPTDVVLDVEDVGADVKSLAFQHLYPSLSARGIFLCVDPPAETGSARPESGTSLTDMMKARIDDMQGWHRDGTHAAISFADATRSITFYDSLVAIERTASGRPLPWRIGVADAAPR